VEFTERCERAAGIFARQGIRPAVVPTRNPFENATCPLLSSRGSESPVTASPNLQRQRRGVLECLPEQRDVVQIVRVEVIAAVALELQFWREATDFVPEDRPATAEAFGGADPRCAIGHGVEAIAVGVAF
jgi:hypothetical protein